MEYCKQMLKGKASYKGKNSEALGWKYSRSSKVAGVAGVRCTSESVTDEGEADQRTNVEGLVAKMQVGL